MNENYSINVRPELDLVVIEFFDDIQDRDLLTAFIEANTHQHKNLISDYCKASLNKISQQDVRDELKRTVTHDTWRAGGHTALVSDREQDQMILRLYADVMTQSKGALITYHVTSSQDAALDWIASKVRTQ